MWGVAAMVLGALALGCGNDECEQIYEMESKCGGMKGNKDAFMKVCSAVKEKNPEEFKEAAACAKAGSCEEMQACEAAARGKKRAKEVAQTVAEGKWREAMDDCTFMPEYFADATFKAECLKVFSEAPPKLSAEDRKSLVYRCSGETGKELEKMVPEFGAMCAKIVSEQLAALTEAVTKARDTGENDYTTCFSLRELAKQAGPDAVAAAETLCTEVDLAAKVKKGLSDVASSISKKQTLMPYSCRMTVDELGELGSEWAKARQAELLKACYVDLGAIIVEVSAKDAKYMCPYAITEWKKGVEKFSLAAAYPEINAMTAKLPAKCK